MQLKYLIINISALLVLFGSQLACSDQGGDAGIVYDVSTGLTWTRCSVQSNGEIDDTEKCTNVSNSDTFTWEEAVNACNNLDFRGYNWRLPNVRELHSIVKHKEVGVMIDENIFPNTLTSSRHYWTSTSNISDVNYAYSIDFTFGNIVTYRPKDIAAFENYVRCVTGP